ncbi:MAG TPA: HAMP domain-containing sensor histidine kinase [Bacteroidales bacterium]|nr:HAMP domain-containing sensor histidine kinase [Bacteroidales bacterium]HPF02835.1 HAMP domain-containing sensor histidine kinase [Bacteroidales bacterium]HPJ60241.1 HAMP domain-containing sensor histidine kinase [Bacteroidales bacterium]HPR13436.1 HAMP domain-containing sensor histidine kinase [Bacteroidales bacterium]HRW86441.1 HAMP domain-containing sensor histidine kinase [Bacteroidales bacterium]
MNRKKFIWLVFMMLFSIIGIIWVQIIWIKNAIGIRNENFDYYAVASLREAASEIESSRKLNFFNNFMFPGMFNTNEQKTDISGYFSIGSYLDNSGGSVSVRITNQSFTQKPGEAPVVTVHDTVFTTDTGNVTFRSEFQDGELRIMQNEKPENKIPSGIYIQQEELINWAKKRTDELKNMSDRMIAELYQWDRTMDITREEVDFAITRSLLFSPIRTPYEFAIIRNGEVTDGNFSKSSKQDFLKSRYRVRLFPDNIIKQDLIVSLIFPERTNYVLGSMAWILGGSLLFSLIILATFAMSLFFIIRQKKVSEMKSDFINNMTHEFKTPIATISLAADTITNPKIIGNETSVRHFIDMIKKENLRMDKKVETILQIASLDKKEIDFRFEDVSLHNIIKKAVDAVDIIIKQRNGKITLNLDTAEMVINGDKEHLYNLVNNLIDNAIKYSHGAPDIAISTVNNGSGVTMSVSDKGTGMSKSVQSKIFDRFYRESSGNVHDVKGFGLGLNYVRAIVDAHKGSVSVFSEPGKGSRFDVYLPLNGENVK